MNHIITGIEFNLQPNIKNVTLDILKNPIQLDFTKGMSSLRQQIKEKIESQGMAYLVDNTLNLNFFYKANISIYNNSFDMGVEEKDMSTPIYLLINTNNKEEKIQIHDYFTMLKLTGDLTKTGPDWGLYYYENGTNLRVYVIAKPKTVEILFDIFIKD